MPPEANPPEQSQPPTSDGTGDTTEVFHPGAESDVVPSIPPPLAQSPPEVAGRGDQKAAKDRRHAPMLPAGATVGDFEIIRHLGGGAMGQVYLARQQSAERQVALKVSLEDRAEGRNFARLVHTYIVQFYGHDDAVIQGQVVRLLWMQYVAGATLTQVIAAAASKRPEGGELLAWIESHAPTQHHADAVAKTDRQTLQDCTFEMAACWWGGRLAEALDFAHSEGILHCDVKPDNILVNTCGQPHLADFNVASTDGQNAGGTLMYAAPEQLEALVNKQLGNAQPHWDLYSLGVVLHELLTGRVWFFPGATENRQAMVADRKQGPGPLRQHNPEISPVLDRIVRRALAPQPDERYQSGQTLAADLDGCREYLGTLRDLRDNSWWEHLVTAHPIWFIVIATVIPNLIGSAINITYNQVFVLGGLTDSLLAWFGRLVLGYNLLVYPLCVVLFLRVLRPLRRVSRTLEGGELEDASLDAVRGRCLNFANWTVVIACLGWLPSIIQPLALWLLPGGEAGSGELMTLGRIGHFAVGVSISCLLAASYSYLTALYAVLRTMYPRLWTSTRSFNDKVRAEIAHLPRLARRAQFLAVSAPLGGAMLVVLIASADQLTSTAFRVLLFCLMAIGITGFWMATRLTQMIERIVSTLCRDH